MASISRLVATRIRETNAPSGRVVAGELPSNDVRVVPVAERHRGHATAIERRASVPKSEMGAVEGRRFEILLLRSLDVQKKGGRRIRRLAGHLRVGQVGTHLVDVEDALPYWRQRPPPPVSATIRRTMPAANNSLPRLLT